MNVLVTGANGFMGTNIVKKLVAEGLNVRAMILKGTDERFIKQLNCEIYYGDVTKPNSLKDALKEIDLVYHLAALPSDAWTKRIVEVNYKGTINMFKESISQGVKKFVYMSSLVVHGFGDFFEADESTPIIKPKWYKRPYIKSKILTEHFLNENKDNMEIVIIRPGFMPFGPYDMLASREMIERIQAGKTIPSINQGKAKMCYVYAENLCDGLISAGLNPDAAGETYILADENPPSITVKTFVDSICDELGKKRSKSSIPYGLALPAAAIIDTFYRFFLRKKVPPLSTYMVKVAKYNLHFSAEKARNELAYESKVSFKEGIKRTVNWFKAVTN